ncbi:polyurethane esterase [Gibbsiella quercinecans]|uniref:polyurethane esterase n=1 Tax=Gibbsiella quercinecans TaxID=929813 RepID=UPI00242DE833|nr:lipase [Gibbsiella quercinecans]
MPIFDYQNEENTLLIKNALTIESINFGATSDASYTYSEENGWKVLDGSTLNYNGCTNPYGAFYGETLLLSSAECNVLGKYDAQGNLINIGISFWGTGTYAGASTLDNTINTALDAASDIFSALIDGYADNYVLNAYKNLMSAVAAFAVANNLTGNDIIITGHSLGGLAVNSMATLSSQGEWNGFFEDSNYIAFASPTQNQTNDNVLNIGYENDPVFRVLNGHSLSIDSFFNHDTPLETCTNNIVSFNDYYAGLTKDCGFFSIANMASWAAHSGNGYTDGILRIMNSEVYDFTHQNSTIIVSNLTEANRATTWVSDLNKSISHTGSTFIIGTESNDLLKGGQGNDYLCGGGGDDSFKDHSGYNIIYGGTGTNTYVTECNISDFTFSHDVDGKLYFKYSTGDITRAEDIQYVNADYTLFSILGVSFNKNDTWAVTDYGLESSSRSVSYAESYYADTENNFTISSASNNSWLYAGANDSDISITGVNNNIVSGYSNDVIHLNGSDNTLLFYGDFGNDTIYNLSTSDSLVFMANQYIADNDSYINHLSFVDDNALLSYGESSVTLVGVSADMLSGMHIAVA